MNRRRYLTMSAARVAPKAVLEDVLVASVVARNPQIYAGYEDDARKFVRYNYGTTRKDLLLSAGTSGLITQDSGGSDAPYWELVDEERAKQARRRRG